MAEAPSLVPLSVNEYIGDGSTTNWPISFAGGFISRDHVLADVITEGPTYAPLEFTWVDDSNVEISPAVALGARFRVYRNTPRSQPLLDFSDGAFLTEKNLDTNSRQAVFIAQEAFDRAVYAIKGETGPTGPDSPFVQAGTGARERSRTEKMREAPISPLDAPIGLSSIGAVDWAISTAISVGNPEVKIPDFWVLGRHEIVGYTHLIISGGRGNVFDPTVNDAGLKVGTGALDSVSGFIGRLVIAGFTDAKLREHPHIGGDIPNAHAFVSLLGGCTVRHLHVHDVSLTGGRIGVSCEFVNGRQLLGICQIERFDCKSQYGSDGGEGYGVHVANDYFTGQISVQDGVINDSGRHAYYAARNRFAPMTFSNCVSKNHRLNTPQVGQVRVAFAVTRCKNVTCNNLTVEGFKDGAIMVAEEPDGESLNGLSADNVRFYDTSIKGQTNNVAAIWLGFQTPSATARIRNVLFDGLNYETSTNGSSLIQYSWGLDIRLTNVDITYRDCTAGARMFLLQGNAATNSDRLTIDNVSYRLINCTGAYSVMRPVSAFCTAQMGLTLNNIVKGEVTGGATVSDWEPTAALSNARIEVAGFTAATPYVAGVAPKPTVNPSGLTLVGRGSLAWASTPVLANTTTNVSITVPGCAVGDLALMAFSVAVTAGLEISFASTAGAINVAIKNPTAADITLPAGTFRATALKAF